MKPLHIALLGIAATVAIFMLSGTELVLMKPEVDLASRVDAEIPGNLVPIRYEVTARYFQQNAIGLTTSVEEIVSEVDAFEPSDGDSYYRWGDSRVRTFALAKGDTSIESGIEFDAIAGDDSSDWHTLDETLGFSYAVADTVADESGQLGNLPDLGFVRRDMAGFHFYLHVIDFHMWEFYALMINDETLGGPLLEVGDSISISEEGHVIDMAEWEGITSDLEMEGGNITIQYIGNSELGGLPTRIFYFQQNQRHRQKIYALLLGRLAFRMPLAATNRFVGVFELDSSDRLVQARFNEYVYTQVSAPFFMKVLVHTKREYIVDRL